jgi:hypothetical protein
MSANHDRDSFRIGDSDFARPDAEIAQQLLQNVNGANVLLCAAVERAFNTGRWGNNIEPVLDDSVPSDLAETARWIGKDHIDRSALDVAKAALSSSDPCTRKVGAHIVGNVDVDPLVNHLETELSSANSATRAAAAAALGYAEQKSSTSRLKKLVDDNDRKVRLTALWALGRMENSDNDPLMINLLQHDRDAEVRRIAAWALGREH